jgi:hypothetical protein
MAPEPAVGAQAVASSPPLDPAAAVVAAEPTCFLAVVPLGIATVADSVGEA